MESAQQILHLTPPTLAGGVCFSLLLSWIIIAVYRLFFHPLAAFPGPRLAAITILYEAYYDVWKGGKYIFKINELHQRYGPFIRISPNEIHVNDPSFYDKLYNLEGRWDKYGFPYQPFAFGASAFTALGHHEHQRRRQPWNAFFTKRAVNSLEATVTTQIDKLSSRIRDFASSGNMLPVGIAYSAMTMDIITEYATGHSYGNLDHEDFNAALVYCFAGFAPVWRFSKHIPWLLSVFMMFPSWMMTMLSETTAHYRALQENCGIRIQELKERIENDKLDTTPEKTIFHDFITTNILSPSGRSDRALRDQLEGLLGGGTEPTAHVLRIVTYHLCQNPAMLQTLRMELRGIPDAHNGIAALEKLEKLPYLTALIAEGLRLSYGVASRMPRIAPDRTLEHGGWKIPQGTAVSMTHSSIFHDENIFPDSYSFSPERFLDPVQSKASEQCFAPFGRGTRSCLGKHLAYAELYLTIATLFSRFDFQLYDTSIENIQLGSDGYMPVMKKPHGVRVTVKKVSTS